MRHYVRSWRALFCALVFSVVGIRDASAQKILLIAADDPASVDDVRAKLLSTQLVTQVDVVDARSTTPTLATLLEYDAVLTWSNEAYAASSLLGDALADYVDQGHGVVQGVFSLLPDDSLNLAGRWHAWRYEPFALGNVDLGGDVTLVPVLPGHPILDGIIGVSAGMFGFHNADVQFGVCSEVVARWSDGEPLVITRRGPQGGRVIGLNLYPPSSDAGIGWTATSDGARLMANALRFAASPVSNGTGPRIALLAADEAAAAEDVSCKLQGLGVFGRVDRLDVRSTITPSLDALLQYDALLTWSSDPYGASAELGDRLADYTDHGRGVVEAGSAFSPAAGPRLDGRWRTAGYRPFGEGPVTSGPSLSFLINARGHAILDGVSTFNGGTSSFHSAPITAAAGTSLVASWSDGEPLVGVRSGPSTGSIAGLNMFPPSNDARADLWDRSTDGTRLIANTLLFVAHPPAAANHAPTANAGSNQTMQATGPAGASFTLVAAAWDADGDPLTYSWSGAANGNGPTITITLAPPAAPAKTKTYTVTLTVRDSKGAEATDTVDLTVTDTKAPVLSNLPSSTVTATATSAAGATVAFGPVTAVDAVDGVRPVSCLPSGILPIGSTTVTCKTSDTRANLASSTFTVRVLDVTTPGRMRGDGYVRVDTVRYEFDFDVRERASGAEWGFFALRVTDLRHNSRSDCFLARTPAFIAFSDDPTIRPGYSWRPQVDTVLFSGTGDWNGRSGYKYEVLAVDQGEVGRHRESVRITITAPNGAVVARVDGGVSSGIVRSERIRH